MRVKFKVWFEKEGEPIISEGKFRLLKAIEEEGSILGAARKLGISYKRAYSQIKVMESRLGKEVVERRRRKGAVLTEDGKRLLREYEKVYDEFSRLASQLSLKTEE
ncbi:winged helix-turn-helix domain-containing protein [Hydrogenivirga sp.]